MAKRYQYTIYRHTGAVEALRTNGKQLSFQTVTNSKTGEVTPGLYSLLDCRTIELIPRDYYPDGTGKNAVFYGDEEARFNTDNKRNPHMKLLEDFFGNPWDVVGDVIKEEEL